MVWELVPGVWKEIVRGGKGPRPNYVKNTKVNGIKELITFPLFKKA